MRLLRGIRTEAVERFRRNRTRYGWIGTILMALGAARYALGLWSDAEFLASKRTGFAQWLTTIVDIISNPWVSTPSLIVGSSLVIAFYLSPRRALGAASIAQSLPVPATRQQAVRAPRVAEPAPTQVTEILTELRNQGRVWVRSVEELPLSAAHILSPELNEWTQMGPPTMDEIRAWEDQVAEALADYPRQRAYFMARKPMGPIERAIYSTASLSIGPDLPKKDRLEYRLGRLDDVIRVLSRA